MAAIIDDGLSQLPTAFLCTFSEELAWRVIPNEHNEEEKIVPAHII